MVYTVYTRAHTHTYTVEHYSAIKRNGFESVLVRWMNLKPVKQSQKNKYLYNHIYTESRKTVLMNLLTGRNRDTGIEKRLGNTAGEGESGTN